MDNKIRLKEKIIAEPKKTACQDIFFRYIDNIGPANTDKFTRNMYIPHPNDVFLPSISLAIQPCIAGLYEPNPKPKTSVPNKNGKNSL